MNREHRCRSAITAARAARVSLGVGIFTCEQTYAALKAMEKDLSPLLAYFVDTAAIRLEYEGSKMNILWLIADWSSVNQSCSFLAVQVASLCTSSTQKPVSDTTFGADVYKHEPVSDNLDWI